MRFPVTNLILIVTVVLLWETQRIPDKTKIALGIQLVGLLVIMFLKLIMEGILILPVRIAQRVLP